MTQIVVMPGGFHPFHAGHLALYNSARKAFPKAEVYVAATNDTSSRPFPFAVKEKLAKLAGVEPGKFIQVKSPFKANEVTDHFDPEKDVLIFVRSEKDANKPPQAGGVKRDGSLSYLQPLEGQTRYEPFARHAYMAYLPTVEFGPGMTSATEIRTAWPSLNEKRKTALVMSLYPKTQGNAKLAATVVKLLNAAIGGQELSELRILHPADNPGNIDVYYRPIGTPNDKRKVVAKNIPYRGLDLLTRALVKKFNINPEDLEVVSVSSQGVAEGQLGNVLSWPEVVNKVSSAMKAMGWKSQRKEDNSFMFSTKGQLDNEFYIVIIDNEGNDMFTYALGTVEEGDSHIGEQDSLPTTEASVSELMNAVRNGFGLAEGVTEAAKKCPPATQDITLNLKNRQKAIDEYGYGPLNPDLPNTKFWMKKVDEWNLDSMEEAQQSLCGNCAAFDIRKETLDCIAQGIDSDSPADAEGVIDAGDLGYCKFLKFKCASRRTCDAWVTGGPLADKPVDENQGWAATYETSAQNFVGGMKASYQDRENQPVAEQDSDYIEEKWSAKYKSSINCANPKGFSQKAHCAGRKK